MPPSLPAYRGFEKAVVVGGMMVQGSWTLVVLRLRAGNRRVRCETQRGLLCDCRTFEPAVELQWYGPGLEIRFDRDGPGGKDHAGDTGEGVSRGVGTD
jgi:hypothetical protein